MNKFLVYTSNLPFQPRNLEEVVNWAKEQRKFMIAPVELNAYLQNVKVGDNLITKKGNSIYVLRVIETSLEDMNDEDKEYVENLARNYNLKKVNITSVANRIKFETWCQQMKPLINQTSKKSTKMNSVKDFTARMKEMFMPTEAKDVRIATDGNLCVATQHGYVTIDKDNNLTSYPEELTIDLPVFVICKPKEQIAVGDVIALDNSYAKVTKINGDKISAISYTGAGRSIRTIKDFLFNQTMIRVVVSLAGNVGGQINPMMLMMLSDNKDSLLPLLMMNQNMGAVGMNPMMLMMLSKEDISTKDLLLMSSLGGNNMFANMFTTPQQTTAKEPVEDCPEEAAEIED